MPPFEIVRVPLETSETIVLDNCCQQAGNRWLGGADIWYLWHFYGFEREMEVEWLKISEESSDTTVDLCKADLLPFVT